MGPSAWDLSMASVRFHHEALREEQAEAQFRDAIAASMAMADRKAWEEFALGRVG